MRVNLKKANLSLVSIFENPNQIITIDANFLIPPNRSRYAKKSFNFALFKKVWIEPIFNEFPKLAIYESVYDELVGMELRNYVENLRQENPPKIIIHFDSELTEIERFLRDTVEAKSQNE